MRSKQPASQSESGVSHAETQSPALQTSFVAHWIPHPPQFWGSEPKTAQSPPQSTVPGGQMHCPPLQTASRSQTLSHAPQWFALVERSKHPPLHSSSPGAHVVEQTPRLHTSGEMHAVPQAPQLAGSL
jgi:hypothetical protein